MNKTQYNQKAKIQTDGATLEQWQTKKVPRFHQADGSFLRAGHGCRVPARCLSAGCQLVPRLSDRFAADGLSTNSSEPSKTNE